jgi:hypothetical protein
VYHILYTLTDADETAPKACFVILLPVMTYKTLSEKLQDGMEIAISIARSM